MPIYSHKQEAIKRRRISREKFGLLVKCLALDVTATQTAKLINLNRNTVNRYFTHLRALLLSSAVQERLAEQITNGVEVDESYFGSRRQRGKRGRGAVN